MLYRHSGAGRNPSMDAVLQRHGEVRKQNPDLTVGVFLLDSSAQDEVIKNSIYFREFFIILLTYSILTIIIHNENNWRFNLND